MRGTGSQASVWACLTAAAFVAALAGCGGVKAEQKKLASLTEQGKYAEASAHAFEPAVEKTYGDKDFLLLRLERGSAAIAAGLPSDAVKALDEAESASAYNYDMSTWDRILQYAINDESGAYYARPHEDIYVNVLKQLAYLQQGKLENGAVMEANRRIDKGTSLRAQYANMVSQLREKDSSNVIKEGEGKLQINRQNAGEFVDSPLGAYLGAIAFAHYDLPDKQKFDTQRLRETLQLAPQGLDPVRPEAFAAIDSLSRSDGNVVVVAFSGRAPEIGTKKLYIPLLEKSVRGAIPELRPVPSPVRSAKVEFKDGTAKDLDLVEDMGAVIGENFRRQEESIYYRAMIRLGLKIGIVTAASLGVQQGTNSELYTTLTAAAGALWIYLTETADERAWTTLPGQARVALLRLPPGPHEFRIVYSGDNGLTSAGPWMNVEAPATGVKAVVDRCAK